MHSTFESFVGVVVEMLTGHALTPFHAVRFGGGLPARPITETPPSELQPTESRTYNTFLRRTVTIWEFALIFLMNWRPVQIHN
jgi:hypothetical protein